jgi:hypothetical protein
MIRSVLDVEGATGSRAKREGNRASNQGRDMHLLTEQRGIGLEKRRDVISDDSDEHTKGYHNTYTSTWYTSTYLYIIEPYSLDHLRYTTIASTVLLRTRPSTKIAIHHCIDCRSVEIDGGRSYRGSSGMIIQGRQLRPLLLVPS